MRSPNRIVIKIGSGLITKGGLGLDITTLQDWSSQIAEIKQQNKEVILVSSGAIAEGCKKLGWSVRPKGIHELQAAAAVGQMGLIHAYEIVFRTHNLQTAQILLTHEDLANRTRYLNARSTLNSLLSYQVVPIINENDTVATNEIRFGDNDTLGALVTNLVEADLLVILTDQEGLYTEDPRKKSDATLVREAQSNDPTLLAMAGKVGGKFGTGGMYTKIVSAKRAALSGADTIIACGYENNILTRLINDGESIGTRLIADTNRLTARKRWLADHLTPAGWLVLDSGAVKALCNDKKSLLPVGVLMVKGEFLRGDLVLCIDKNQKEVARGLINYSAREAKLMIGCSTKLLEKTIEHLIEPEMIHRDNIVILQN